MEWKIGTQYNIGALQAIMAVELGGETLQRIAGINTFAEVNEQSLTNDKLAKHLLQTRWLIIDEISMVSATLLAQIEEKIRKAIQEQGTFKVSHDGEIRPFGGLNVLYVGDFYQLAPPDGAALTSVPDWLLTGGRAAKKPNGRIGNGLELFWGGLPSGVQGMTELITPHRCKYLWYNEVLNQIRTMELSNDNYKFLHGRETTVPGSWVDGKPACGRTECRKLVKRWAKEARRGAMGGKATARVREMQGGKAAAEKSR